MRVQRYEWDDHQLYRLSSDAPRAAVRTTLSSSSSSLVQATSGCPFWTPQNTNPRVTVGLSLRRHGPGDWMLGGQIAGLAWPTVSANAPPSDVRSRLTVKVDDVGPPASVFGPHDTAAVTSDAVGKGAQMPRG